MRVSDVVAEVLVRAGVTHVFMLTGGGAMHLNDALGHRPGLNVVCCHHEQALAMAADAYARITGRPACVNVTTGPGGINALNGVFGAHTDSLPMIVVSGQVKRETMISTTGLPLRQLGDQEVDIVAMVKPITKMAEVVFDASDARYLAEKAVWMATSGRPGAVWLDVPVDVQAMQVDFDTLRSFDAVVDGHGGEYGLPLETHYTKGEALRHTCTHLLERLRHAKRPVILAGTGIRISGAYAAFRTLIERLGIPVATAWNAHDLLPNAHPLYAGRPGPIGERAGNFTVQNSDLCIVLGTRLSIRQVGYNYRSFARHAYRVMVDIDRAELMKPTIAIDLPIHADLAELINMMLTETEAYSILQVHREYVVWAKERLARYPTVLPRHRTSDNMVNPYAFAEELFGQLQENDIIVTGDGTACTVTFQVADIKEGQRLFHNNGAASMGFDLPAAIGACYTAPINKRVICIAGDGSVMQNIQELQTISGANLPVKIIVLNNNGYHSIRQTQENYFDGRSVGCGPESGVSFPDFERLAAGFRLSFYRISSYQDLSTGIADLLATPGPAMLEVMLDQNQVFEPKLGSQKLPDGSMVTSPLEDQSPLLDREEFYDNMIVPS